MEPACRSIQIQTPFHIKYPLTDIQWAMHHEKMVFGFELAFTVQFSIVILRISVDFVAKDISVHVSGTGL